MGTVSPKCNGWSFAFLDVVFPFQPPILNTGCFLYCIYYNPEFLLIEAFVNRKQFLDPLRISRDILQMICTRTQSLCIRPVVEFKAAKLQSGLTSLLANGSLSRAWILDLSVHTEK